MDNRDDIIRSQMDMISELINQNLKDLADELWPVRPKVEKTEKEDNIVQFPDKWYSD